MRRILGRARARRRGARARRRAAYDEPVEDQPTSPATRCSRRAPASPPPGCRRWPTTAGCASTRSTGCRACSPPAGPGRAEVRRRATTRCCSPSSRTSPTSGAAPTSRAPSRSCHPDGARAWSSRAGWTAGSSARCGAAAASATTCCSCADGPRGSRPPSCRAGGEGRDLAPRPGAAGDRAPGRGRWLSRWLTAVRDWCARRDSNSHCQDLNLVPLPLGYGRASR